MVESTNDNALTTVLSTSTPPSTTATSSSLDNQDQKDLKKYVRNVAQKKRRKKVLEIVHARRQKSKNNSTTVASKNDNDVDDNNNDNAVSAKAKHAQLSAEKENSPSSEEVSPWCRSPDLEVQIKSVTIDGSNTTAEQDKVSASSDEHEASQLLTAKELIVNQEQVESTETETVAKTDSSKESPHRTKTTDEEFIEPPVETVKENTDKIIIEDSKAKEEDESISPEEREEDAIIIGKGTAMDERDAVRALSPIEEEEAEAEAEVEVEDDENEIIVATGSKEVNHYLEMELEDTLHDSSTIEEIDHGDSKDEQQHHESTSYSFSTNSILETTTSIEEDYLAKSSGFCCSCIPAFLEVQ